MVEPRLEGGDVHPQFIRCLRQIACPGERLPQLADPDELACHGGFDQSFLAGRQHQVGGQRTAADVLELVRDRAAPLRLQ